MYSPYSGLEFLAAYVDDRLTYLKDIRRSRLNGSSSAYISLYAKSCKLLIDHAKISVHRDELEEILNSIAPKAYQGQSMHVFDVASLPSFKTLRA